FSSIQLLKLENWVEPFPKHWHDEWGIALTEKGVNRFWHRGGWHDSDADTIIVVPPGEIHDGGLARDPWAERMIYIPVEVMERIAHACSKQRQPLTFVSTVIRDDGLAASLRGLHHTLSTGGPEAGEADELQVRVIGTLLERHGSVRIDVPRSDERAVIRRAKHLMRERASTPITLPDLANDVGMSL